MGGSSSLRNCFENLVVGTIMMNTGLNDLAMYLIPQRISANLSETLRPLRLCGESSLKHNYENIL